MSITIPAYAALNAHSALEPYAVTRRTPGTHDVAIEIQYCGVCHSDIHQARDEWGGSLFPMVPGHEIVGIVTQVGNQVSRFQVGDRVGIGCFVDSCRQCNSGHEGLEQYCEAGMNLTYNGLEKDGRTPTYGGYSSAIVVDENYLLRIPKSLNLDQAAPLLCAGITTYSPLRHWHAGPGKRVAVVGLGGLGHMAVKLARAMGAEVTVLSHSLKKKNDGLRMGAKDFYATSEADTFSQLASSFDLILNTVSVELDWNQYLSLLKRDGTLVLLGVPPKAPAVQAFSLIGKRRNLAGSLIGGIAETQEMLNFCAEHKIAPDIELISIQQVNEAYERMIRGDVRYRFVIDLKSLKA